MSDGDRYEFDDDNVVVSHEKAYAAGIPAVVVALQRGLEQMGVSGRRARSRG